MVKIDPFRTGLIAHVELSDILSGPWDHRPPALPAQGGARRRRSNPNPEQAAPPPKQQRRAPPADEPSTLGYQLRNKQSSPPPVPFPPDGTHIPAFAAFSVRMGYHGLAAFGIAGPRARNRVVRVHNWMTLNELKTRALAGLLETAFPDDREGRSCFRRELSVLGVDDVEMAVLWMTDAAWGSWAGRQVEMLPETLLDECDNVRLVLDLVDERADSHDLLLCRVKREAVEGIEARRIREERHEGERMAMEAWLAKGKRKRQDEGRSGQQHGDHERVEARKSNSKTDQTMLDGNPRKRKRTTEPESKSDDNNTAEKSKRPREANSSGDDSTAVESSSEYEV